MFKNKEGPSSVSYIIVGLIFGLVFCAGGFNSNATLSAQENPSAQETHDRNRSPGHRTAYDLPSGGGKAPLEDEDYAEAIQIFGTEIFADSLYLCVEHTEWMKGERTAVISTEFNQLVSSLSSHAKFGSVVFNEELHLFRNTPVAASFTHKSQMKIWESSREHKGEASMAAALEETLKIAHLDSTKHRAVVLIIDDRYSVSETALDSFAIANLQNKDELPIHVFFITSEVSDEELETTCRLISSTSGGQFKRIPITPDPDQPLLPTPLPPAAPTSPT